MKQPLLMLHIAAGPKAMSLLYHTLPGKQVVVFFCDPQATKDTALVSFLLWCKLKRNNIGKGLV